MSAKCCCKLTKKNVLKRLPFTGNRFLIWVIYLFCFCWYFGFLLSLNGLLVFLEMLLCSISVGYEKRKHPLKCTL